ncbi:hypothetical protein [Anaerocolumna chitinilytica]|uniref:Uncharacterized protein n=1 Tax=Anaerocolumna chitinilytica TaxID=1727145 RepID=A0A7M3SAK0_9FIRM|nr:hypothetical protein [Anaerocolumna chitinilytica]BCK01618.1 hypothetical protein bsdcttw_46580 [Anaerocolumna chitinilytica]
MNKDKLNAYINQRKYEIHTGINAAVGSKYEIERRLMANRLDELLELEKFIQSEPEETCITLPCKVGDTVYIIEQCCNIEGKLDGTLWDGGGGYGTATGYYCPYEDRCPHDTDDCDMSKQDKAVFEDEAKQIIIDENYITIIFENCNGKYASDFGKTVFLSREEAQEAIEKAGE